MDKKIKVKVQQEGSIRVLNRPKPEHRQVTFADYSMDEIQKMLAEGWKVMWCQLQRPVECDAIVREGKKCPT
jgi:hypothetical protein